MDNGGGLLHSNNFKNFLQKWIFWIMKQYILKIKNNFYIEDLVCKIQNGSSVYAFILAETQR